MSFWAILILGLRSIHAISYASVAYVIPALLTVKAVIHRDSSSYVRWASYWLIQHTLCPILSSRNSILSSWIQIGILAWMSLRGGASTMYGAVVYPLVRTYQLQIDQALSWIFGKVKRAVFVFLAGSGWSLLENVCLTVQAVTTAPAVSFTSAQLAAPAPPPPGLYQNENGHHDSDMVPEQISLSPYVLDFLVMLSKGIYLFSSSSNYLQNAGNIDKEVHQLRIFAYNERHCAFTLSSVEHHEGVIRDTITVHQVLQIRAAAATAKSHDNTHGKMIYHDNHDCKIEILVEIKKQNKTKEQQRIVILTLSSLEDRDTMVHGLNASLPYLKRFRFCSSDHDVDACGRRNNDTITNKENNMHVSVSAPSFKPSMAAGHTVVQRSKARRRNRASY